MTPRQKKRPLRVRRSQEPKSQALAADDLQQLQEILRNLASVLLMSGCGADELSREFSAVCSRLKHDKRASAPVGASKIDHIHVISHWYRDPDYLDAVGKPRKLSLFGSRHSLTALIKNVLPTASPEHVVHTLLELKAVRESRGRFEPTSLGVDFGRNREHIRYWNMKALHSVLQNMVHNFTSGPENLFIGRAAINPRFPASELKAFHQRIAHRTSRFLNDLDAGMQRLEVSDWQKKTTELGVLVFAFENPVLTGVNQTVVSREGQRRRLPRSRTP